LQLPLPEEVFAFPWALSLSTNTKNLLRLPEDIQRDIFEFNQIYVPLAEVKIGMGLIYTISMIPQEEYKGKYFISLLGGGCGFSRYHAAEEYFDTPISSLELRSFAECWTELKGKNPLLNKENCSPKTTTPTQPVETPKLPEPKRKHKRCTIA